MLLFLLTGSIALMTGSAVLFIYQRAQYARWVRAAGTLLEMVKYQKFGEEDLFSPRVSFQAESGETVEFVSEVRSSPAPQFFGPVPVLYPPGHPEQAIIDRPFSRYPYASVLFGMGVILLFAYLIELGKSPAPTP